MPTSLPAPDAKGRLAMRSALTRVGAPASPATIRPKLTVNRPGDAFEQEADRAAEHVMRMPDPGVMHHGPLRGKAMSTPAPGPGAGAAPPQVHQALRSPGRPLDPASRAFMEARFGSDFSRVRIHTDAEGAESAEAVNAKAYTVGSHIVFGTGRYRPGTDSGRRLLAHELAHTLQGGEEGGLHRAEVEDRNPVCEDLQDIAPDVNRHVNGVLNAARTSPGLSNLGPFFQEVVEKTAGTGPVSPIEYDFIEKLPAGKKYQPPGNLAGTRFELLPDAAGLGIPTISDLVKRIASERGIPMLPIPGIGDKNMYYANAVNLPIVGNIHVVGPTVLIGKFCVGGDKLGHFFQQGWQYAGVRANADDSLDAAVKFGQATEIDKAGLATTGVYSNADLAANRAGLDFWDQLAADPSGFVFDISKYISADWNEYANPNYYEASVARHVWATQLTGAWKGSIGTAPALDKVAVNLTVTPAGEVTGTFTYPSPDPAPAAPAGPDAQAAPVKGTLAGTLRFLNTKVSGTSPESELHADAGEHSANPVSGVAIDFEWNAGSQSGHGTWESKGERSLKGTLGLGTANTGQGAFDIDRM